VNARAAGIADFLVKIAWTGRVTSPAHALDFGAGERGKTKFFKLLKKKENLS